MARRSAPKTLPKQPDKTPEEQLSILVGYSSRKLRTTVSETHEKIRAWGAKIAYETANPCGGVIYTLSWAAQIASEAAYAFQCERVVIHADRLVAEGKSEADALITALGYAIEAVSSDLLDDRYSGGSTSGFSNAVQTEERAARSTFYRRFGGELEGMKILAAAVAAERATAMEFEP